MYSTYSSHFLLTAAILALSYLHQIEEFHLSLSDEEEWSLQNVVLFLSEQLSHPMGQKTSFC